jgi:hypothetical protein
MDDIINIIKHIELVIKVSFIKHIVINIRVIIQVNMITKAVS